MSCAYMYIEGLRPVFSSFNTGNGATPMGDPSSTKKRREDASVPSFNDRRESLDYEQEAGKLGP